MRPHHCSGAYHCYPQYMYIALGITIGLFAYMQNLHKIRMTSWRFNYGMPSGQENRLFQGFTTAPKGVCSSSVTYSVCACTVHQDVKLMMAGSRLETLNGGLLKHY